MDKDTKQALEDWGKGMEVMRNELESLKTSVDDLRSETETKIAEMRDSLPSPQDSESTSKTTQDDNARLLDRVAELEDRNQYLEGSGYQNQVITTFLRDLDADNFHYIGIKLGYLEDAEAGPEDLPNLGEEPAEVVLGDHKLLMQKAKPEDPEGWEYSETQELWIKIE